MRIRLLLFFLFAPTLILLDWVFFYPREIGFFVGLLVIISMISFGIGWEVPETRAGIWGWIVSFPFAIWVAGHGFRSGLATGYVLGVLFYVSCEAARARKLHPQTDG